MTKETPGGWTKKEWFPMNHFRWNENRRETSKWLRWRNGQFTSLGYRLEQLWERRPPGLIQPFLREWRPLPVCKAGFDSLTKYDKPIPYKEGDL